MPRLALSLIAFWHSLLDGRKVVVVIYSHVKRVVEVAHGSVILAAGREKVRVGSAEVSLSRVGSPY